MANVRPLFLPMRDTILIAPDKFKGTFSAEEVADIIASELTGPMPMHLQTLPMADGGEGTPSTLNNRKVLVSNDFIGPHCFGDLPLMERSSYALGEAIKRQLSKNESFYVAIGGTATSDGGAGVLQALGAKFYTHDDQLISSPISPNILPSVVNILLPEGFEVLLRDRVTLLCDVKASLLGPRLSSLDFAKQKGATEEDVKRIRQGLEHLKNLLPSSSSCVFDGAGGGVAYALASVAGADALEGSQTILNAANVDWDRIALVISGEGRIDNQTAGGKVVACLLKEARSHGIPFIGIGGYIEPGYRSSGSADEELYFSCLQNPLDFNPSKAEERLRKTVQEALPNLLGLLKQRF